MSVIAFLEQEHQKGFGFPVTPDGYLRLCFVGLCSGQPLVMKAGDIERKINSVHEGASTARLSYLTADEHKDLLHRKGKWVIEIKIEDWKFIPRVLNRVLSAFPTDYLWITMLCRHLPARFVSHGRRSPSKAQEWSWEGVEHRVAVNFYAAFYGAREIQTQNEANRVSFLFTRMGRPAAWLSETNWLTEVGRGFCRFLRQHCNEFEAEVTRKKEADYDAQCRKFGVLKHGGWPCA